MKNTTLIIKTGKGEFEKVDVSDIKTIKSDGNYSLIDFLQENKKIILCKSLKSTIEDFKLENFVLIRRGLYVNFDIICKYKGGKKPKVILKNGEELLISRRRIKDIKDKTINQEQTTARQE